VVQPAGRRRRVALAALTALWGALLVDAAGAASGGDFGPPQRVTILGYAGDTMEPFLSRDGRFLLFNDSNAPGRDTNLHLARRVDDLTYAYRGPLAGANSPHLDGVASLDRRGRLVFVSTRSYPTTLSTLYEGHLTGGRVRGVKLLAGVSRRAPGWVNFDAELAADGALLVFVDGFFGPKPTPLSADLVLARRKGAGFARLPSSDQLLAAVNTAALEYAPALAADGRELFFTRFEEGGVPALFRSVRPSTRAPFAAPEPLTAAVGFVEAPTLSPDGRVVIYHRLEDGVFVLYRITRDGG
jgi:hypothetical protein